MYSIIRVLQYYIPDHVGICIELYLNVKSIYGDIVWRSFRNDFCYRIYGPTVMEFYKDGSIKQKIWSHKSQLHRRGAPACILYYNNGKEKSIRWYHHGMIHRIDGPALIFYDKNGIIETQMWYMNDELHREDGPAIIDFCMDGNIQKEIWCVRGKKLSR